MSFRIVSPKIMITGIETIMQYIFFEKRRFEDGFLPWKYDRKSLKEVKRHLEMELASVFFMAN